MDTGASRKIGGFDDSFPSAGGEDLDFGIRLRAIGRISWSPNALVRHRFADDLAEFDARFVRYGVGMRRLSEKLGVRLEPYKFRAASPDLQDLADRQTRMMRLGYHQGSSNGAQ